MTPTLEYLGHRKAQRADTIATYQVYVCWLPADRDLLTSAIRLAADAFACPECERPWSLARPGGVIDKLGERAAFRFNSISDSCPGCPTILHFDCTPVDRQLRLNWPRTYECRPHVMGDRPARTNSRFVKVGAA
jgi:hypothetical protein